MKIKKLNRHEKRLLPLSHSNLGFACIISNNPKIDGGVVVYIQISTHFPYCQRFHFLITPDEQPFQYGSLSRAILRSSASSRILFQYTA